MSYTALSGLILRIRWGKYRVTKPSYALKSQTDELLTRKCYFYHIIPELLRFLLKSYWKKTTSQIVVFGIYFAEKTTADYQCTEFQIHRTLFNSQSQSGLTCHLGVEKKI